MIVKIFRTGGELMNRREFLKISCSGLITLYLSGCGLNMSGPCVHKDDIETEAIQKFMEADLIALVSPVYYFALTAQLKTVIDRFYSRTYDINGKQSVLLSAGGSDTPLTMRSIVKHYETLAGYMHWQDRGRVLAPGCPTREAVAKTEYPQKAFELGMSL